MRGERRGGVNVGNAMGGRGTGAVAGREMDVMGRAGTPRMYSGGDYPLGESDSFLRSRGVPACTRVGGRAGAAPAGTWTAPAQSRP